MGITCLEWGFGQDPGLSGHAEHDIIFYTKAAVNRNI
jgi:hypothetical protein